MEEFDKLAKDVFVKSEQGRKFLDLLVDYCNVYKSTFTGDAVTTAYNEGVRSVALKILQAAAKSEAELTEDKILKGSNPWLNKVQQAKKQ